MAPPASSAGGSTVTIPNWGRIVPSQGDMLAVAGHVLRPYPVPPGTVEPDEERLDAMRAGREGLRRLTGQDCGYDLAAWHRLLLSNPDWGYTHPYARRAVHRAVEAALADPDRLRLVKVLEQEGPSPSGSPSSNPVQDGPDRSASTG
jgi:hypothetical protein